MGAAVAERHAEALRVADGHVRAELTGRRQQRQREEVGGDGDVRAGVVRGGAEGGIVLDRPVRRRVLQERPEYVVAELERSRVADDDLDPDRLGAAFDDGDRLRVARLGDEELRLLPARLPEEHAHRLGRGRALVEERGIRDRQPGEVGDDRLKVEQGFEPALRDLGLIRGVLRVPARILEHVPQDDRRRDRVVVAHPEVRAVDAVPLGERARPLQQLRFRQRIGEVERPVGADAVRHGGRGERIE